LFCVESALLTNVGCVSPDPKWELSAHMHACWEFIYFLQGSGRVDVPQATLRPQQYHLVVYPPGLPHAEMSNPVDPEETIFLAVEVQGNQPPGAHLLLPDRHGEIGWLCRHILDEFIASGLTPLAQAYTHAFLHLVERSWTSGIPVQHDAIDFIVKYMHSNYANDISLDNLANAACISKTHLAHCFRDRLGTSPLRYLQHIRIEIAKRLLATSTMPVNEIATQVGFSDPLYFSRVMKAATGQSPKAFRQTTNCTKQSISCTIESIHHQTPKEV